MSLLQQIESVNIAGFGPVPLADNDAEFQPSQTENELVEGMRAGDGGFIRKANVGAQLDMTVLHKSGFNVQAFNGMKNVIITIKYTDGETHVMSEACCVKAIKGGKDGKIKVEFHSAESRLR